MQRLVVPLVCLALEFALASGAAPSTTVPRAAHALSRSMTVTAAAEPTHPAQQSQMYVRTAVLLVLAGVLGLYVGCLCTKLRRRCTGMDTDHDVRPHYDSIA
jgi:hypothetical protein